MKILTIGASPYLIIRNGLINKVIIKHFKSLGHEVSSAVWHHDEGYFLPTDEGQHFFEDNNVALCELFPFVPKSENCVSYIYEVMKVVQPDIVITIGDYKDTSFLFSIKAMYPSLFKWISICTFDSHSISNVYKEAFEYADLVVSTSKFGLREVTKFANCNAVFAPFGIYELYFDANKDRKFVLCSTRNAYSNNIGAFLEGTAGSGLEPRVHTNVYDPGEYNLNIIKNRYCPDFDCFSDEYCSIKDGFSFDKMLDIYNNSFIIAECSSKSATGLSVLEGMACGCIPVGPNFGRIGEIISELPKEFQFYISYNKFVSSNDEEIAIISSESLKDNIIKIKNNILNNKEIYTVLKKCCIEVASKFTSLLFLKNIEKLVEKVSKTDSCIALEIL